MGIAEREPAYGGPAVFGPEVVKAMIEALDLAWQTILASRHAWTAGGLDAETRLRLAQAIVEAARTGTRDRARLSESALRCMFPLGLDGQRPNRQHSSEQERRSAWPSV